MNKILKIQGLDCANCARELEEEIEKIKGVHSVRVDFMGQKVFLECEEEAVERVAYCCNHFEDVKVVGAPDGSGRRREHDHDHDHDHHGHDHCGCGEHEYHHHDHDHCGCGEHEHHHHDHGHDHDDHEHGERAGDVRDGKKIRIENLCCANCARELEEELNAIDGVEATVDFMHMTVILKTSENRAYERAVDTISHFEDVRIVDGKPPKAGLWKTHAKAILSIAVSAVFFLPALVIDLMNLGTGYDIAAYVCYAIAFIAAGWSVLLNTVKNLAKGKIFDENFLMTVASVGAIALGIVTGDGFMEGVAVMLLYQIGELLQSIAVGSSRRSISNLMDLKSETATLLKDGEQTVVSPEDLRAGDVILIKAGEKVPVDAVVIKGTTSLDMKSLNGESAPRDVAEGDEILSGSINLSKVIEARVVRTYENSAVAKILELVENSTAKKAPPERFITKFAKYYTPVVVIAAVLVAALVPTAICAARGAYVWATYGEWIYKALSFLVISCPCALVISVPLTYFGGIGRCAKSGILVKGSTCLDELAKATVAAFDKTGTLTEGCFAVKSASSERALQLAACAEKYSSHPIAAAFAAVESPFTAENPEEIAGRGVQCTVDGKVLLCGNAKMLEESGVKFAATDSPSTVVYVALDGEYVGVIEIDDRIKEGAAEAVGQLRKLGVGTAVMLTGDSARRAEGVAQTVGLDGFKAGLLPDEKLEEAVRLKEKGGLIYVGDGINDAPVMTCADCAVSMGKVGSDAAIEASDVVLVSDNLGLLPKGKKIAKGTRRIVFQNIVGSLLIKFAIMALDIAIAGFPMMIAIFGDVGVMLLAVLNAMRTGLIK